MGNKRILIGLLLAVLTMPAIGGMVAKTIMKNGKFENEIWKLNVMRVIDDHKDFTSQAGVNKNDYDKPPKGMKFGFVVYDVTNKSKDAHNFDFSKAKLVVAGVEYQPVLILTHWGRVKVLEKPVVEIKPKKMDGVQILYIYPKDLMPDYLLIDGFEKIPLGK